jgi:hypothetical protein
MATDTFNDLGGGDIMNGLAPPGDNVWVVRVDCWL